MFLYGLSVFVFVWKKNRDNTEKNMQYIGGSQKLLFYYWGSYKEDILIWVDSLKNKILIFIEKGERNREGGEREGRGREREREGKRGVECVWEKLVVFKLLPARLDNVFKPYKMGDFNRFRKLTISTIVNSFTIVKSFTLNFKNYWKKPLSCLLYKLICN